MKALVTIPAKNEILVYQRIEDVIAISVPMIQKPLHAPTALLTKSVMHKRRHFVDGVFLFRFFVRMPNPLSKGFTQNLTSGMT